MTGIEIALLVGYWIGAIISLIVISNRYLPDDAAGAFGIVILSALWPVALVVLPLILGMAWLLNKLQEHKSTDR